MIATPPLHITLPIYLGFLGGLGQKPQNQRPEPPTYDFRLIATYPHDRNAFTQGLYFEPEGTLLESTGLYGASTVRRVDLTSGEVLKGKRLPDEWFGEGLTVLGDRCIQLLWREGLGIVRDRRTLEMLYPFELPKGVREGWGLTTDGKDTFYMSDGTSSLHVLDSDLVPIRKLTVRVAGRELPMVNELQWIEGRIWANVWMDERLACIDPTSGEVCCFVDLQPLLTADERRSGLGRGDEVLNGLAYDAQQGRLFVTGKCWPRLYEIEVLAPEGPGGGKAQATREVDRV